MIQSTSSVKLFTIYHTTPAPGDLPPDDGVHVPFIVGPAGPGSGYAHDRGILPATFASERCQHHVWRHPELSLDYLGFESYRRRFVRVPTVFDFDIAIKTRMTHNGMSIGEQFISSHNSQAWGCLLDALIEKTGDLTGTDSMWLAPCCHWIIRYYLFDEFMAWWWNLVEVLLETVVVPAEGYQSRMFSFLSDRMFTIWLIRKQLKFPRLRVIDIDTDFLPHGLGVANFCTAV